MAQLLATKNALPCSNGCLLWGNGSTWVLMEWAKIFIQNFFAAKVLVWIIDEDISDLKIHLSPICRVRTFPGPFFTFEFHPIEGVQELWGKSFKWSGRGLNPGPSACQSSIITTIPRSFVVAGPMMWLLWMSTSSIQYSNTMQFVPRGQCANHEMLSNSTMTTMGWVCPVRTSYLGLIHSIISIDMIARP